MRRLVIVIGLMVALIGLASPDAQAIPISGQISFDGAVTLNGTIFTATQISTFSGVTVGIPSDGAYAGLIGVSPPVSAVFSQPIIFAGPGATLPSNPLWTITYNNVTYSFNATSMSYGTTSIGQPQLIVGGSGIAHISGEGTAYEDTFGTWSITTQGNGPTVFRFSANTAVPEPATLLLLGAGLLGAGLYRRTRRG